MSYFVGGALLEYSLLTFSTSDYLVSLSGVPDYQLTLWYFCE